MRYKVIEITYKKNGTWERVMDFNLTKGQAWKLRDRLAKEDAHTMGGKSFVVVNQDE